MAEQKLDIFNTLKQISVRNYQHFNLLSDDEKKAFIPFVVARWLSGINDPAQIMMLNELVNPVAFDFGSKHKQLLFNLMAISSPGKSRKYTWSKLPGKRSSSKPIACQVIMQYYGYNSRHAADALDILSAESIIDAAYSLGYQTEQIKKLQKELKSN